MDVRIGVTQTPKELEVELPEGTDAEALSSEIERQLSSEGAFLWLTDRKGRKVGVPASKVAYVELDAKSDARRVGFGTASR